MQFTQQKSKAIAKKIAKPYKRKTKKIKEINDDDMEYNNVHRLEYIPPINYIDSKTSKKTCIIM